MGAVTIVCDSPEVLSVAAMTLRSRGHEVREALGGMDALRGLPESPVDVLIADARLPDTTGADLIRDARRLRPGLPAVMLTDYNPPGVVQREAVWGAVVLAKPFRPRDVLAAVERALSASRPLAA
jgi:CheY-like chemotaxis protein